MDEDYHHFVDTLIMILDNLDDITQELLKFKEHLNNEPEIMNIDYIVNFDQLSIYLDNQLFDTLKDSVRMYFIEKTSIDEYSKSINDILKHLAITSHYKKGKRILRIVKDFITGKISEIDGNIIVHLIMIKMKIQDINIKGKCDIIITKIKYILGDYD